MSLWFVRHRASAIDEQLCLPVRWSETMKWKYQDDMCGCGQMETEEHVLFECNRYGQERERWRGTVERLKVDMCEYEGIKG